MTAVLDSRPVLADDDDDDGTGQALTAQQRQARKIVVKCCEDEAHGMEGPDGTPHSEGCNRRELGRLECCGAVRRHGHTRGCPTPRIGRWSTPGVADT